jgi:hypothetical protein
MNNKLWTISAAMLLSGAIYQTAIAAEADPGAAMESAAAVETVTFESLDADANGAISQDEAQSNPALSAVWEEVDTNKDGQLDEAEFSAVEITGGSEGGAQ